MKPYLLLFLIQFLYQNVSVQSAASTLCFITYHPAVETLQFADELELDSKQYGLDVYVIIDDDSYIISSVKSASHFIPLKMSKEKSTSYGYQQSILTKWNNRMITAWDKALLYFRVLNQTYSFLWFIEDDLFIPSLQAFRSIHQLYSTNSDRVVPKNRINLLGLIPNWFWQMVPGLFVPPWSRSMVNVVGFSRRMLSVIANDVRWRGKVAYHEFLFQTLAISLNMKIVNPLEFSTVYWGTTYTWEQIRRQLNNFGTL